MRMRMRSSSRQPSLAISHRRSCGQDKSNCQLRTANYARRHEEMHSICAIRSGASPGTRRGNMNCVLERWMRVECLLPDGNCNSGSSCSWQLPVGCGVLPPPLRSLLPPWRHLHPGCKFLAHDIENLKNCSQSSGNCQASS